MLYVTFILFERIMMWCSECRYIHFEFHFPSPKYTVVNNKEETVNLKYSTNSSYHMMLNKTKTYNFASIFEIEILEDLSSNQTPDGDDVTPSLYFEVNSVDYWNRHRIEGYGLLPLDLDRHRDEEICVSIWRPIGTIREEMRRFFIGGGKRLKDYKSIAIPESAKESSFNARPHWNTLQTGNVYLKLNAVSTYNQTLTQRAIHSVPKNIDLMKSDPVQEKQRKHSRRRSSKLLRRLTMKNQDDSENQEIDDKVHGKERIIEEEEPEKPILKPIKHKRRRHTGKRTKLLQKLHVED